MFTPSKPLFLVMQSGRYGAMALWHHAGRLALRRATAVTHLNMKCGLASSACPHYSPDQAIRPKPTAELGNDQCVLPSGLM